MKKTSLFNAIITKKYSLLLFGGILIPLFLICSPCCATTMYEEDFNLYSEGVLDEQDSWDGSAIFGVQGDVVKEGAEAIEGTAGAGEDYIKRNFDDLGAQATGTQGVYMRAGQTNKIIEVDWFDRDVSDRLNNSIMMHSNGDIISFYDTNPNGCVLGIYTIKKDYEINTWYWIETEWKNSGHEVRWRVDDEAWSDWKINYCGEFTNADKVGLGIRNNGVGQWDFFSEDKYSTSTPPAPEYPELNPNWSDTWLTDTIPPEGFSQATTGQFASFPISGILNRRLCTQSPCTDGDPATYYELDIIIEATDFAGFFSNSKTIKIPIDWDYSEATSSFSTTTSLNATSSNYKISYMLSGWNAERGEEVLVYFNEWSFVSLNSTWFGEPSPPELPELPEMSVCPDCATSTGIEKWTCGTQKILCEIFWPTPSKVKEVIDTNAKIKDKAPFNYVNAFNAFITDIKDNLTSTEDVSLRVWGDTTTTLNFDWLEATNTIAGTTFKFSDLTKGFFGLFMIFGLVAWGIGFIKRIVK